MLLTKPNKCLVAMCPFFLIVYNKNAKVLCTDQCSNLKCILHGALLEPMRFYLPTNLTFFIILSFFFFFSFSLADIIFYFWI